MSARLTGNRARVTGAGQGFGSDTAACCAAAQVHDRPGAAPGARPRELNATDANAERQTSDDPEAAPPAFNGRHPMGRWGRIEEAADAARARVGRTGAVATAQVLPVDGGQTL